MTTTPAHPAAPETAKHSQDAANIEELFGGGPKLPDTYWMEKYAKASSELARLRASEARLRKSLGEVIGLAASYVESQCMRSCEPVIESARAALAEGGAK